MPTFNAEVTATHEIEFEVFCARCGAGLCSQSKGGNTPRRGTPYVKVQPCESCMDESFEKGVDSVSE